MNELFFTFNVAAFDWFIDGAATHYEKSAPTVATWLDQVADRLRNGSLTVREIGLVQNLIENGIWLDPHGAANRAYKAMSEFGALPSNVTLAF